MEIRFLFNIVKNRKMQTRQSWFKSNRGLTVFLSFLIIVIIGLYAWKQIEKKGFNRRLEDQKVAIISNSRKIIDEKRKNLVLEVAKSLSWAVRSEAQRNNFEQVNLYLNDFIKNQDFELAMFVNADGIITVSTDKRIEQTPFRDHFADNYTSVNEIIIQATTDNKWIASAPVMGLNDRAGTLILIYYPKTISDNEFFVAD